MQSIHSIAADPPENGNPRGNRYPCPATGYPLKYRQKTKRASYSCQ